MSGSNFMSVIFCNEEFQQLNVLQQQQYVYCTLTEVFLNLTKVFLTLTEVFPCFFLSCKANARVKLAKTGHGPHSSTLVVICVVQLVVLFYVLFVCKCVLPLGDNPTAVNKYIINYSDKLQTAVVTRMSMSVKQFVLQLFVYLIW
jgi:hypothetical protein